MKFSIESQTLNESIISVIKAMPVHTSMPVLDGILFRAENNCVRILCSDLMMQKECTLPALVEEEGECVLLGKSFAEFVRKLPNDILHFYGDNKQVKITCGKAKRDFACIEYEEFPIMSFKEDEVFSLTLKKEEWKKLIDRTAFAVGDDDGRPMLAGVYLETAGNSVTTVATDSFQFAMNSLYTEADLQERNCIIPGKTVIEVSRMTDETAEETFTLTLSRTHIKAEAGSANLVARLLDGKYIEYKRLIPKECKTRVLIDKEELLSAVDRATLVSREGNNSVKLSFREEALFLDAESSAGKFEEDIPAQIMGPDIDIAFNPHYMINVLKNLSGEKIYLEMNTSINPCVFKPQAEDGALYLIVPMRVM